MVGLIVKIVLNNFKIISLKSFLFTKIFQNFVTSNKLLIKINSINQKIV
jgi:hypothetical protein